MKLNRKRMFRLGLIFLFLSLLICYVGAFIFVLGRVPKNFNDIVMGIYFSILSLIDVYQIWINAYPSDYRLLWMILKPFVLFTFYGGLTLITLGYVTKEED